MGIRGRIGAGFVAAAAATLLVTAGPASADDGSGHSEGHGKTVTNSFDWHVSRDSDGKPHGYFKAVATSVAGALVAPQGPATCVEFDGNRVGFLYPLAEGSRPEVLQGQYILITGEDNGGHGRDRLGFVGPAPKEAFPNCRPGPAPLAVDGHISVHEED